MKGRRLRRLLGRAILALFILLVTASVMLWFIAREALGHRAAGVRLERMEASPQWRDGKFRNVLPRVDGPMLSAMREFFFGGSAYRSPGSPIITVQRSAADYAAAPASGLRVTWLGHSTLLLEIDGRRVLIDPVWGKRASMFAFAGPERFYAPPLPLAELPEVDVVLISHDHYDHLDVETIRTLAARGARFAVPLGVGAHLVAWGVAEDRITEHDWWDSTTVGGLTLTAVPARHFSGRGLTDQAKTLWSGWTIASPKHRVYYSGDTAMQDAFVEIGERLGPFDLTMIEVGAYDAKWADVHLGPEQAVRAHRLVKGDVMLPVHWGLFDLALHGWTEPIERVLVAAEVEGVRVAAPRPGDRVEPAALGPVTRWWPDVPWKTAAEAPVQSTGTAHLMGSLPQRVRPDSIASDRPDSAALSRTR
jgi:L-ascorbate metabolism protein UlaG (beta-lactamase superfamily)